MEKRSLEETNYFVRKAFNFICVAEIPSLNAKCRKNLTEKISRSDMCNFLFGDSVLTLNYKYNQATSSAKTFFNPYSSSRCKPKEYPPPIRGRIGGGTRRNGHLEEICLKELSISMSHLPGFLQKRLFHFKPSGTIF